MTTEEELAELRKSNIALIQDLTTRFRGLIHIDPRTGADLMYAELVEAVFPPGSDERTAMLIRVEERTREILIEAKTEAVKAQLTGKVSPAFAIPRG